MFINIQLPDKMASPKYRHSLSSMFDKHLALTLLKRVQGTTALQRGRKVKQGAQALQTDTFH